MLLCLSLHVACFVLLDIGAGLETNALPGSAFALEDVLMINCSLLCCHVDTCTEKALFSACMCPVRVRDNVMQVRDNIRTRQIKLWRYMLHCFHLRDHTDKCMMSAATCTMIAHTICNIENCMQRLLSGLLSSLLVLTITTLHHPLGGIHAREFPVIFPFGSC